jgi:hypothetical protein
MSAVAGYIHLSSKPVLMKNQTICILFSCFLFVACTKNEVVAPVESLKSANALASDSNFIKMLALEKQLTHFINQLAIEKSLTIVELQNKLQYLHDKDLNSGSGDQLLCGTIQAKAGVVCIDNYCPIPD